MKKRFNKILAMLLSFVLVFGIAPTAFANSVTAAADAIGEWNAVILSGYVGTRGATLSPQDNGILVTRAATGQHDHNNGMTFNLAGLRALANRPDGDIVITGVLHGAGANPSVAVTGDRVMILQALNTSPSSNEIDASGNFTITVTPATPNSQPTWADGVNGRPMLASPNLGATGGQHGSYLITGITIGGVDILGIVGPPIVPWRPPTSWIQTSAFDLQDWLLDHSQRYSNHDFPNVLGGTRNHGSWPFWNTGNQDILVENVNNAWQMAVPASGTSIGGGYGTHGVTLRIDGPQSLVPGGVPAGSRIVATGYIRGTMTAAHATPGVAFRPGVNGGAPASNLVTAQLALNTPNQPFSISYMIWPDDITSNATHWSNNSALQLVRQPSQNGLFMVIQDLRVLLPCDCASTCRACCEVDHSLLACGTVCDCGYVPRCASGCPDCDAMAGAGDIIVPSTTNPNIFINLTTETIHGIPFPIEEFSLNGGGRWRRGTLPTGAAFSRLFNRGFTLSVRGTRGSDDGGRIDFPPINRRPRRNAERLRPWFSADTWALRVRPARAHTVDSPPPVPQVAYQWVLGTDRGRFPQNPVWEQMPEMHGFDIAHIGARRTYFFRSAPTAIAADGGSIIYTPTGRQFRVRPTTFRGVTSNLVNYRTETMRIRQNQEFSIDGGATWSAAPTDGDVNRPRIIPLDVSQLITDGNTILVRTRADGRTAGSVSQTITLLPRADLVTDTTSPMALTVVVQQGAPRRGRIDPAELRGYRIINPATGRWSSSSANSTASIIRRQEGGEFQIRQNETARTAGRDAQGNRLWQGYAASLTGTLVVYWGDTGRQANNGRDVICIISAYIVPPGVAPPPIPPGAIPPPTP